MTIDRRLTMLTTNLAFLTLLLHFIAAPIRIESSNVCPTSIIGAANSTLRFDEILLNYSSIDPTDFSIDWIMIIGSQSIQISNTCSTNKSVQARMAVKCDPADCLACSPIELPFYLTVEDDCSALNQFEFHKTYLVATTSNGTECRKLVAEAIQVSPMEWNGYRQVCYFNDVMSGDWTTCNNTYGNCQPENATISELQNLTSSPARCDQKCVQMASNFSTRLEMAGNASILEFVGESQETVEYETFVFRATSTINLTYISQHFSPGYNCLECYPPISFRKSHRYLIFHSPPPAMWIRAMPVSVCDPTFSTLCYFNASNSNCINDVALDDHIANCQANDDDWLYYVEVSLAFAVGALFLIVGIVCIVVFAFRRRRTRLLIPAENRAFSLLGEAACDNDMDELLIISREVDFTLDDYDSFHIYNQRAPSSTRRISNADNSASNDVLQN